MIYGTLFAAHQPPSQSICSGNSGCSISHFYFSLTETEPAARQTHRRHSIRHQYHTWERGREGGREGGRERGRKGRRGEWIEGEKEGERDGRKVGKEEGGGGRSGWK